MEHGTWNMEHGEKIIEEFLSKVREVAAKEKSIFLRWDPPFLENEINSDILQNTKYKIRNTKSVQPQQSIIMNLLKTEEELLGGMHEKTRYNVRLAERRGVLIRQVPGENGMKAFWILLQETAGRDRFSLHPKAHYEKLFETFPEETGKGEPFMRLYIAEHNDVPNAAALVMFWAGRATYLHGASSGAHRDLMAPHLLHWRIMQDAKKMGCVAYDLWGIDDKNPRWAGITRFKRGFGGEEISWADSADVFFRPAWYGLYRIAKKFS